MQNTEAGCAEPSGKAQSACCNTPLPPRADRTTLPPTNLSGLPFSAPYCREDNLKKGMQESADRLRKLEREYQVRRGANVLHSWLSNAALLNCFVLCSSDVDGAAAVQLV